MKILKNITTSKLIIDDKKIHSLLDNEFSFFCQGHQFTNAFKKHRWNGKKHFYRKLSGWFPTGLLNEIVKFLQTQTTEEIEIIDSRIKPHLKNPIIKKLITDDKFKELRPYQVHAVDDAIKAQTCIVKAATNAGKTEIFAELIRKLNLPTIVLVHRKELLYQTAERLNKRLGVEIGIIGDGKLDIKQITVAMVTSMVKYKINATGKKQKIIKPECRALLDRPILIFDECHTILDARTQYFITESNAFYKVALSGTPLHNDIVTNYILKGLFGQIAFEITNAQLVALGVSSKPICYFFKVDEDIDAIDYRESYEQGIINSDLRNTIIKQAVKTLSNLNVLIITREIDHGNMLNVMIPNSVFIHGGHASKHRQEAIKQFKAGKIKTLIASTILDEGVDISNIDFLIIAAGMKSQKRLLQRIGRGMRKKESNKIIVLDFFDIGDKYLLDHSVSRIETVKAEGFEVKLLKNVVDLKS